MKESLRYMIKCSVAENRQEMIKVARHIEDIDANAWKALVENSTVKSFFQTRQCYDLYSAMSFMEPFIVAVEEDGRLAGVVAGYIQKDGGPLKSFLSRRAIVNGGPLLADGISAEALEALLKECRKCLNGRAIYVEFRNFDDYSAYKDIFRSCGFKYEQHLNFHIDTSSLQTMEDNLGKSRKRDIKYSLKEGAVVVSDPSEAQLNEFYQVLEELYRTKVKTPLFPYEFFSYLGRQPYAKIQTVEYGGKTVGGTVCVCLEGRAVYEWFACGQDGVYKNVYPSTLATYSAMKFAAENGYPRFDMMGAGSPGKGYGVREFKAKFGGKMVEHGRFVHVFNPLLYGVGKLGVKFMKSRTVKRKQI